MCLHHIENSPTGAGGGWPGRRAGAMPRAAQPSPLRAATGWNLCGPATTNDYSGTNEQQRA
jgi:hypothetical protein